MTSVFMIACGVGMFSAVAFSLGVVLGALITLPGVEAERERRIQAEDDGLDFYCKVRAVLDVAQVKGEGDPVAAYAYIKRELALLMGD